MPMSAFRQSKSIPCTYVKLLSSLDRQRFPYKEMNQDGNTMRSDSEAQKISGIAKKQIAAGNNIGYVSGVTLISPHQKVVDHYSRNPNIRKIVVGGEQESSVEDKVVLLFGTKGVGKTSLIDSMLNYLYDVRRGNTFRFTLRKESASTTGLTEYVINNSILPFTVAIVDTPGLVNEKGYKGTSGIIKEWFEEELRSVGEFRLDAISLVLKNDEDELGWPYIHELAEVKRMFGDDLKTNVLPVITHTEILPQPLAVHALAYANVTFLEYYKVNNDGFIPTGCIVTANNKTRQNRFFIDGMTSLDRYFTDLHSLTEPMIAVGRTSDVSHKATTS
uniref:AIG1-type G domain-containing protein n=1 Tax=Parascaris univalens TaxID=6257 RepID=A0A915B9Y4_PARUN